MRAIEASGAKISGTSLALLVALVVGCAPKEEPAGSTTALASNTSAAGGPPTSTSTARAIDPTRLSDVPTRCAREVAPSANGTARFERPAASSSASWTLVMNVSTLDGGAFDVERKPHAFGSVDGEPTVALENGRLVVRTAVKFTRDPVATVVVGVKCGGETGLLSVGVRWSDANLDSGTPFEAQIAAVGGG